MAQKWIILFYCFVIFNYTEEVFIGQNISVRKKMNKQFLKNVACVAGCKGAHPRVHQRFSDYKLDNWCEALGHWYEELLKPRNRKMYTYRQRNYLNSIYGCRSDEECFGTSKVKRQLTLRPPAVRRECRTLSKIEFRQFTDALDKLKNELIDGVSKYDLLISYHDPQTSPEAHFGPAFLPFHREYVKQLEVALRRVNPKLAMCYWDSNLDEGLPKAQDSVLWSSELLGNGNDGVVEGPFANWTVTYPFPGANDSHIHRGVGESDVWDLYTEGDFEFIMSKTKYQELGSYCTEPTFTVLHNSVHEFVGGHMIYTPISPNDPAFFLHHTFVDYLWETWRLAKQTYETRETDYPQHGPQACGSQHYADAPMRPFPMLNKHGLNNSYATLYKYAPTPTCKLGCIGPYLFCDTVRNRCLSKVRPGGNCTGLEKFDSCYKSTCLNGKCTSENIGATTDASQSTSITSPELASTVISLTTTESETTGFTSFSTSTTEPYDYNSEESDEVGG